MSEAERERFKKVHLPVREDWLAKTQEAPLDPDLEIIDAHHHLWDAPRPRYLLDEFLADAAGNNVVASIYVESRSMYRVGGPEEERALGETEFANGLAAMAASGVYGPTRVCDGIIGYVDLRLGEAARPLLEKHQQLSGRRFVGVRNLTAHHPDPEVSATSIDYAPDLMHQRGFQAGVRALGDLGLVFDAFVFHPQLEDIAVLAKACPDTIIVIDHLGCPVGVGPYRGQRVQVLAEWSASMSALARYPNLRVKLGGFAMRVMGFAFETHDAPPGSDELARSWQPYFDQLVKAFGAERCMFESNFPVDKGSCSYTILWNAYKKMAAALTPAEKRNIFAQTARNVYRLGESDV